MNGELANLIALALHGSAWLADPRAEPPRLEVSNSTFRFVGQVAFEPPPAGQGTVTDSAGWFSALRDAGVTRLWLEIPGATDTPMPPHVAAAFVNTGSWRLLATGRTASRWTTSWSVVDQQAADSRIWGVHVVGAPLSGEALPPRPSVPDALDGLVAALTDTRDFARDHQLDPWAAHFDGALEQARSGHAEIRYHTDLVPPGVLGAQARHLLAVASHAWVFGGMGSWNDVWVPGDDAAAQLGRVSSTLYDRMLDAFVAATNSDLA